MREEIRISVGTSFALFEGVAGIGQKFKPTLNAGVVFTDLENVLKRFVVGVDAEFGRPEVAEETFDGSNDTPSLRSGGGGV